MDEPIYLALGTNLGDRIANLQTAINLLSSKAIIVQESSVYVTPPWGIVDQPDFLNQVIEISTNLTPSCLLRSIKDIELKMGRQKTIRNGPRLIDLDILFYGAQVINKKALTIPHPRLHERAFVLVPLYEIAPDFVHPVLNETVKSLLAEVDPEGVQRL